jgi:hypothetical protein
MGHISLVRKTDVLCRSAEPEYTTDVEGACVPNAWFARRCKLSAAMVFLRVGSNWARVRKIKKGAKETKKHNNKEISQ